MAKTKGILVSVDTDKAIVRFGTRKGDYSLPLGVPVECRTKSPNKDHPVAVFREVQGNRIRVTDKDGRRERLVTFARAIVYATRVPTQRTLPLPRPKVHLIPHIGGDEQRTDIQLARLNEDVDKLRKEHVALRLQIAKMQMVLRNMRGALSGDWDQVNG